MTYPRNFEYRLHELDEAGSERTALLRDMGDTYPELRPFFARIEPMLVDPDEAADRVKRIIHLEECVQGLENTAMFRDQRIIDLEGLLDRARGRGSQRRRLSHSARATNMAALARGVRPTPLKRGKRARPVRR